MEAEVTVRNWPLKYMSSVAFLKQQRSEQNRNDSSFTCIVAAFLENSVYFQIIQKFPDLYVK